MDLFEYPDLARHLVDGLLNGVLDIDKSNAGKYGLSLNPAVCMRGNAV